MSAPSRESRRRRVRSPALAALAGAYLALAGSATAADRSGDAARWLHVPEPAPIRAPAPAEIRESIRRGVTFLLHDQQRDGSWGSPHRTKGLNIYAPVPGAHDAFRNAVTGLVVAALIEVEPTVPEIGGVGPAIDRGRDWLLENLPHLRRATPDALYNVWGHAYAIQGLVRVLRRADTPPAMRARIRELIALQIDYLGRYESVDGGWGYYDFRAGTRKPSASSISFTTATVLVALREARDAGIDSPPRLVRRAVASIVRQRKPDFSYIYGEYLKLQPMRGINRPGGSLGRSQACNLALRLWGDEAVTDEVMEAWLKRLFARNLWLDIGRKRPVPHESWFQVAGYFYYYGHYYAARCIEALPAEVRPYFQSHLARILLDRQERDGSWWDYPFYDYHQPYGTAFSLMALERCLAVPADAGRDAARDTSGTSGKPR